MPTSSKSAVNYQKEVRALALKQCISAKINLKTNFCFHVDYKASFEIRSRANTKTKCSQKLNFHLKVDIYSSILRKCNLLARKD